MITRTVKELKVFDIKSSGDMLCGHGYCDSIPSIAWVDGQPWESTEECDRLYAEAYADWERRRDKNPWGTTSYKPELKIYWKTISIDEDS